MRVRFFVYLNKRKLFTQMKTLCKVISMSDDLSQIIENIAQRARLASLSLSSASTDQKNNALKKIAEGLEMNRKILTEENQKDLDNIIKNDDSIKDKINFICINTIFNATKYIFD